jgi:hypothetical protein
MSVFELFLSKENIKTIKESISITVHNEFQQKIGNRYDDLIENKMKELTQRVSDKIPDGKSKKDYILMMNKKLISLILPTIRANAIKEKPKTNIQQTKKIYDDPQDLLKQNKVRDDQFNLPLEDMSQRFIPDYPRQNNKADVQLKRMENERNIYQNFANGMPSNIPKFQDDLPEKRPDETLALFNQLKASYTEERIKNGDDISENENVFKKEEIVQNNDFQNPFQKKKVILRKNKFETPIEELNKIDEKTNIGEDNKIKELLTPIPFFQNNPNNSNLIEKKRNKITIHFSSNYRNFEYHKSSSSIRIYLTPYFDNIEDNFVYFSIPEYIDKHGNMIYDSFTLKHNMNHHIQIPSLKNIYSIQLNKIKLNKNINQNKLKAELLPRIKNETRNNNTFYHNYSYEKNDLFLYDKNEDIYKNINEDSNIYIDLQNVIRNNFIQINIYDIFNNKLFYEKDILHIYKIEKNNEEHKIILYKKYDHEKDNIDLYNHKQIYIYSLLPHENNLNYVEFNESVFLESVDMLIKEENKFKLCALYVINDETNYKINFKELFDKCKKDLEDDTHKNVSDLFYFVIKQQYNGKPFLYYCNIDYIDELGNIILIHKEAEKICENYENTEQFGFIKKNYNGVQYNDNKSLFRKEGFNIQNVKIDEHNEFITFELNNNNNIHFDEDEAFIRFEDYEIDLFLNIEFN